MTFYGGERNAMGNKGLTVETNFGTFHDCYLKVDRYVIDNSLFIAVENDEEGQIAVITKRLNNRNLGAGMAYVDDNNCLWAAEFIKANKLGDFTHVYFKSGYCSYPLYKFDLKRIKRYEK